MAPQSRTTVTPTAFAASDVEPDVDAEDVAERATDEDDAAPAWAGDGAAEVVIDDEPPPPNEDDESAASRRYFTIAAAIAITAGVLLGLLGI